MVVTRPACATGAILALCLSVVSGEPPSPQSGTFPVVDQSISSLQTAMRSGRVTSGELVRSYLTRIETYDRNGPALGTISTISPLAILQAEVLDEERRLKGPRGPLHGVPVLVSDAFETADMPTSAGSRALQDFSPGRDAFVVKRLRDAGAVVLGKSSVHELGLGVTSVSTMHGQTRNPYALNRNPGGSNGGAAAAVASSLAAAAIGMDSCGDIRVPAAHNNLFGLRTTFGLASRQGILPVSRTQESPGFLTRTVADLALLLNATIGVDPADPTTGASRGLTPRSYQSAIGDSSLSGIRIGVLTPLLAIAASDQLVADTAQRALEALNRIGAEVFSVSIPDLVDKLEDTDMAALEFKFDLSDYLAGQRNPPVVSLTQILDSGQFHPSIGTALERAVRASDRDSLESRRTLERRSAIRTDTLALMKEHQLDALAYPVIRQVAAPLGEEQAGSNCQLSTATGLPAIALPVGFAPDGMPVGLELLGGPFREGRLLTIAYAYEQSARPRRPPATTPELQR